MKKFKTYAWMMATVIACLTATACSLNDYEQEKPFTTCPVEHSKFFACEASDVASTTMETTVATDTVFTEDDIEWFNVTTREIRFTDTDGQLFKKLMANYHKENLEFHLGENVLFTVSRFVSDFDSRVFYDLVLHYSTLNGTDYDHGAFYLDDCYPSQFINEEIVQENIKKNAAQWEAFVFYLDSKGKLRK